MFTLSFFQVSFKKQARSRAGERARRERGRMVGESRESGPYPTRGSWLSLSVSTTAVLQVNLSRAQSLDVAFGTLGQYGRGELCSFASGTRAGDVGRQNGSHVTSMGSPRSGFYIGVLLALPKPYRGRRDDRPTQRSQRRRLR